jgi:hypothetical protein
MPAEVPGIHEFLSTTTGREKVVDGWDKPGHDEDLKSVTSRLKRGQEQRNPR